MGMQLPRMPLETAPLRWAPLHILILSALLCGGLPSAHAESFNGGKDVRLWGVPINNGIGTWTVMASNDAKYLSSKGGGEQGTGALESDSFVLQANVVRVVLRGWNGPDGGSQDNRVDLIDAITGETLHSFLPPQSDAAHVLEVNTETHIGKTVRFRAIDGNADAGYAWLAIDSIDAGPDFAQDFGISPALTHWQLGADSAQSSEIRDHFGVPYLVVHGTGPNENGSLTVHIGARAERLLFIGMRPSMDIGVPGWHYPSDYSMRFFVGDQLGSIRVFYEDGAREDYPLILGDSLWWGKRFHDYPLPFEPGSPKANELAKLVRFYPAAPNPEGRYVAALKPREGAITHIEIIDSPLKRGTPIIEAITVATPLDEPVPDTFVELPAKPLPADTAEFITNMILQPALDNDMDRTKRIRSVRNLIYTTEDNFPKHVARSVPEDYDGPQVTFEGNVFAEILTNVFHHNVHDVAAKVDAEGMYHTSTPDAADFGGYQGFGTFSLDGGVFSNQVWSRDLGRALQELTALGLLDPSERCVDFCLKQARVWSESDDSKLKVNGQPIPPHWCRNLTDPNTAETLGCWENDGHGLVMLFVYNCWRRLPRDERDAWLRERWDDIELAGDWIEWQFENPALSRATTVLFSDSECAYGYGNVTPGHSVFADTACREGLLGFADMASSIGEIEKAKAWRERAAAMKHGIDDYYVFHGGLDHEDVWRIDDAGWAYQSGLLGPLIHPADRGGLAPEDGESAWRKLTEVALDRLVAKWTGNAPDSDDPWWFDNSEEPSFRNTPNQQFTPVGSYGIAMGYGQGFITQAALLLDRMTLAEECLEWTAKEVYYADHEPYIVPEGVTVDPSGSFWFRTGDLGNGVQQGEILKVIRLVLGIDDTDETTLKIFPRTPASWSHVEVDQYPVWYALGAAVGRHEIHYELTRESTGQKLIIDSPSPLPELVVRLGPFAEAPDTLWVNGEVAEFAPERSGDSTWQRVTVPSGFNKVKIDSHK